MTHNKSNTSSELFPGVANFNSDPLHPRPEEKINNAAEMMTNDSPPKQELNDNTGGGWLRKTIRSRLLGAALWGEQTRERSGSSAAATFDDRKEQRHVTNVAFYRTPLINRRSALEVSPARVQPIPYIKRH